MTHRAELRRGNGGTDAWNRDELQTFEQMDSKGFVPCHVFFAGRSDDATLVISDDKTARLDKMMIRFPVGLDVRTEDRLGDVTDRRNQLLYKGPFVVRQPTLKRRHIEARLEGHAVGS